MFEGSTRIERQFGVTVHIEKDESLLKISYYDQLMIGIGQR